MKLPGGAHAKTGGPKAARIAADAEANRTEAAHADEPAAGRLDGCPIPIFFKDSLIAVIKIGKNIVSDFSRFSSVHEFGIDFMIFRPFFKNFFLVIPVLTPRFF